MEKLQLDLRHGFLRINIKKLENINLGLNEDIESHINYLEGVESMEEMRASYLDLLVSVREQANLLKKSVDDLTEFNNDYLLNHKLASEYHIKPFCDEVYKKEVLKARY